MCLGIPVEIIEIKENNKAICNYLGVEREIDIRFLPDLRLGDFVILHAGFAIQKVAQESVREVYDILREYKPEKRES